MDFSLSQEQTLLQNSVSSFLRDAYDFEARRNAVNNHQGMRRDVWKQFADLGLLAASLPEQYGGLGGGGVETMVIMEQLGKYLVTEPWMDNSVLCGSALALAKNADELQQLASGETIYAFAYSENQSVNPLNPSLLAEKKGSSYSLNGEKLAVIGAPFAQRFVVVARTSGKPADRNGVMLFLVDADAPGVLVQPYPTVDSRQAANITFSSVNAKPLDIDSPADALDLIWDRGLAALSAEASGAMQALHETTLSYVRERKQFNAPIGSFQAVQHRMVDVFIACEEAASMTCMAAIRLDDPDPHLRSWSASAAKAHISQGAQLVGQEAVQLHGGMGMTDELNVSHYFRRLTTFKMELGDLSVHSARLNSLRPLVDRS